MNRERNLEKAARCGEPSYVWRAGQERRLRMILGAAGDRASGLILDNGCGLAIYLAHLAHHAVGAYGVDSDLDRAVEAGQRLRQASTSASGVVCADGESLPYKTDTFDMVLSNEVLEHIGDDKTAVKEIIRVLKRGGRLVVFVPNRGYPFETHGVYWGGSYHFGNIPLVNYLPTRLRSRLAPHVRAYTRRDLDRLFEGLPVRMVQRTIVFGGYDNITARWPRVGRALRGIAVFLERTPLRMFGLSHFWVLDKT